MIDDLEKLINELEAQETLTKGGETQLLNYRKRAQHRVSCGTRRNLNNPCSCNRDSEMLLNLLAVIHRDGGHHVEEVGLEQACEDAQAEYYRLRELAGE